MKTIEEIKELIRTEFTDPWGRVTLNPAKDSLHQAPLSFDSENQLLYTGQYAKLLDMLGELDLDTFVRLKVGTDFCKIRTGLYNRHPGFTDRTISHDELNGLAFLSSAKFKRIAEELIEYGQAHDWAFVNENPGSRGWKLSGVNLPVQDGKPSRRFFPYVHRIRQPRDRAFYKMVAGKEISWIELLNFCLGAILSATSRAQHTSGKIMWFFKLKCVDTNAKFMLKLTNKFFNFRLRKQYGANPLKALYKIFFRADHPFHLLVEHLKE